jgi:hypothetical protein
MPVGGALFTKRSEHLHRFGVSAHMLLKESEERIDGSGRIYDGVKAP